MIGLTCLLGVMLFVVLFTDLLLSCCSVYYCLVLMRLGLSCFILYVSFAYYTLLLCD